MPFVKFYNRTRQPVRVECNDRTYDNHLEPFLSFQLLFHLAQMLFQSFPTISDIQFSRSPATQTTPVTSVETQTITLLCRIADDPLETDFVEFDFSKTPKSGAYERLLTQICHELEIDRVDKLRRLPCIRVRNDSDVERLKDNHQLEVIRIKSEEKTT